MEKKEVKIEKRRKSGILKHKEAEMIAEHHADHIKWDEETIQEHNKERGTRQKIEESKTPYSEIDPNLLEDVEMKDANSLSKEEEVEMQEHLKLAKKNRELNAHL